MKVLLIDVSVNSSYNEVIRFLDRHNDAQLVFIFDYQYGIYSSTIEVIEELRSFPDDYFIYPSAYNDLMIRLLSRIRRSNNHYDIYVCSNRLDDCSIYSSSDNYSNYLYHLNSFDHMKFHGLNDYNNPDPKGVYPESTESFLDKIISSGLNLISKLTMIPASEDDIDY